jgi:hypothetical protein
MWGLLAGEPATTPAYSHYYGKSQGTANRQGSKYDFVLKTGRSHGMLQFKFRGAHGLVTGPAGFTPSSLSLPSSLSSKLS